MTQSPKELATHFFDDTAKTYEKVACFATLGQDNSWKKQIMQNIHTANTILELACGTGILTRMLAKKFPNAKITAVDASKSYLDVAKQNCSEFPNITLVHQDAESLDLDETFDCVCSSYIPKYCDPKILIPRCKSRLNPQGCIILHDFIYPQSKLLQHLWNLYFKVLQFTGLFIPSWRFAFSELPKLIKDSNWVADYTKTLHENNFTVTTTNQTCGTSSIIHAKINS